VTDTVPMSIRDIESIKTPLIRDVLWAYREFYFLNGNEERRCGCTEGNEWPHLTAEDGTPLVCEAHEWQAKRKALQHTITMEGFPISDTTRGVLPESMRDVPATMHPLHPVPGSIPYPWEDWYTKGSGAVAASIAWWLTTAPPGKFAREHIVFSVSHSELVTKCYQREEQMVRDILLWAPVLVYWHNEDIRSGNGWMLDLIKLRQYGLSFVVGEGRRES
jgi:hypothetical protein